MSKPFLSVIIPAFNEAKRLPLTLVDIDKHLSAAEFSSEIIVVNDGSSDETADIVRRFQSIIKNLRLLDNKENHGKGWVVRQGMLEARGNWRLFTDADNSTSVDQVQKMIPFFKEKYEVVIGSRAIRGAKLHPPQPWYRQILGKGGNLFIQLLAVPGIWDTQCGFKCFSEEATQKIFSILKIDRWGFDVEALVLAREFGYKIKEIPVVWINDIRSRVGIGAYFSTLIEVIKIRWWLLNKKYPLPAKK